MKKNQKNRRTRIKPLWWVIGAFIVAVILYVGLPDKSSPEQQVGPSDSESGMLLYKGNGYEILYPNNWQLDESEQEAPAVIIASLDNHAKVYIQAQYDPRLITGSGKAATIKNLTDAFRQNPDYSITSTLGSEINGNVAYLVNGTFKDNGKQLEFREYTIFGDDGNYYSLRINNNPGDYQKALDGMVSSFTITQPNQDEVTARDLVETLGEVQTFKKQVQASGRSTFGVQVDRKSTTNELYYIVQVYEIFPDHMTTFNWYRVNPTTWVVERQDLATDTWEQVD